MKIALTSDVHLEFGDWNPSNPEGADLLILGGDIMVAADFGRPDPYNIMLSPKEMTKEMRYRDFLERCKANYKHVIYIMGNHEHYNGDFATSKDILHRACSVAGVTFLDKETITIDDVTFIGGTLWTDMNKEDPMTLHAMSGMMNDFICVKNSNRVVNFKDTEGKFHTRPAKFSPDDAVVDHKEMLNYIRLMIEGKWDQKFVVVGHHAPSKASTHPRYKDEYLMNGGYSTELSEFILDHPQIKAWTHGHTHEEFDYMIGSTRVMCNPRGYVNYERGSDAEEPYLAKVFEV